MPRWKFRKHRNIHPTTGHADDSTAFGSRLADRVAAVGGSWGFIIFFGAFLLVWATFNTIILEKHAFDPYPFVFLNLILSMVAALQAPVIMMSQNRQASKDRHDAELDAEVNRRSELNIELLHDKVDHLHNVIRDHATPQVTEPLIARSK